MKADNARFRLPLILLSVVSVVIALGIAEVGLRWAGVYASYAEKNNGFKYTSPWQPQEIGWLHTFKPFAEENNSSHEFAHYIKCNSLGLNDREWALQKTKPLRIACIGDSFTEGVGAPPDSSYTAQLEKLLDTAEVMNCGVSGSDPVFGYMLLKEKLLAYRPDVVVVTINNSDVTDVAYRGGLERFAPNNTTVYSAAPWWQPLYAHCYLVRLFIHKIFGYNYLQFKETEWEKEVQRSLATLRDAMNATQQLCRQHNVRCIFLFHPLLNEVKEQKQLCQPLIDSAKNTMEVIDLYPALVKNGLNNQTLADYFWPHDTHNTGKGYGVFARALAEQIGKLN